MSILLFVLAVVVVVGALAALVTIRDRRRSPFDHAGRRDRRSHPSYDRSDAVGGAFGAGAFGGGFDGGGCGGGDGGGGC